MLRAASETNSTGYNLVRVSVAARAAKRMFWVSLAARTAARSIVMALQIEFWPSWLGSGFCLSLEHKTTRPPYPDISCQNQENENNRIAPLHYQQFGNSCSATQVTLVLPSRLCLLQERRRCGPSPRERASRGLLGYPPIEKQTRYDYQMGCGSSKSGVTPQAKVRFVTRLAPCAV